MLNLAVKEIHDGNGESFRDSDDWNRLRDIVRSRSFSEGDTKTLASGKQSKFYFNMKRTMAQPEALHLIGELILPILHNRECDFVGGLEMGAVPVLNAIAQRSYTFGGKEIPLFWIRKKSKDHGTRKLIEGQDLHELTNHTAVMVDDVTTSGGSVLKAIIEARKNNVSVDTVITLVDRLEGARENLAKEGIDLICLFDANDFRGRRP